MSQHSAQWLRDTTRPTSCVGRDESVCVNCEGYLYLFDTRWHSIELSYLPKQNLLAVLVQNTQHEILLRKLHRMTNPGIRLNLKVLHTEVKRKTCDTGKVVAQYACASGGKTQRLDIRNSCSRLLENHCGSSRDKICKLKRKPKKGCTQKWNDCCR